MVSCGRAAQSSRRPLHPKAMTHTERARTRPPTTVLGQGRHGSHRCRAGRSSSRCAAGGPAPPGRSWTTAPGNLAGEAAQLPVADGGGGRLDQHPAQPPGALPVCGKGRYQQAGAGVPVLACPAARWSSEAAVGVTWREPPVDRREGGWIPGAQAYLGARRRLRRHDGDGVAHRSVRPLGLGRRSSSSWPRQVAGAGRTRIGRRARRRWDLHRYAAGAKARSPSPGSVG
jgi:hypothetical protein